MTPSESPNDPMPSFEPNDVPTGDSGVGPVPVVRQVSTTDPVVFITIDDGYSKDPRVVELLRSRDVPVTPFVAVDAVRDDHEYFARITEATGQTVQNHTSTHPFLSRLGRAQQETEICGAADTMQKWYGVRPWLFRPPYGDFSMTTRQAARACGMSYLVLWDVSLPHRVLRYASGTTIKRGDIILIHWRPDLARDLPVALDAIAAQGLRVAALQDYLPKAP